MSIAYYYGADTYAAREAIGALAEKRVIRWLDEPELQEKGLGDWLDSATGLFGDELVVVRDLSRMKKATQTAVCGVAKEYVGKADGVVWDRELPDKRSGVWKTFKPAAREFSGLGAGELTSWLQAVAKEQGAQLMLEAATVLIGRVGVDRWRLRSEVMRLGLQFGTIDVAAVEAETASSVQAEIFATLDALVAGKRGEATRNVEALLADGNSGILHIVYVGVSVSDVVSSEGRDLG